MMHRIVIISFLLFLNLGCQHFNQDKQLTQNQDSFIVDISIIMHKKDVIEVFYLDSNSKGVKFSEEKKNRKIVEASKTVQTLRFKLPLAALSYPFRIDLGNDVQKDAIRILSIVLKSSKGEVIINGNEIKYFFTTNNYLKDNGNGYYNICEIDNHVDPFIISKAVLSKRLEIEL